MGQKQRDIPVAKEEDGDTHLEWERLLMRLTSVALYLLLLAAPMALSQSRDGTVTGTVLDERNQPIPDARVCTVVSHPVKSNQWTSEKQCFGHTDITGQFQIQHLPMGTFSVSAEKLEDGYADFNLTNVFPTVTLTPEEPFATVVVKLEPQGGILVPFVKDKVTGKRLFNFMVHWTVDNSDNPANGCSGGAGFSQLTTRTSLPKGKDILLEVTARGYRKWVYSDGAEPPRPMRLRLQSGEQRVLKVELEPEVKSAPPAQ